MKNAFSNGPCDDWFLRGDERLATAIAGIPAPWGTMDDEQWQAKLELLRREHRDLDDAIEALSAATLPDQLQLARLKRRKLRLRDEIAAIGDRMIPDIIA